LGLGTGFAVAVLARSVESLEKTLALLEASGCPVSGLRGRITSGPPLLL
jgi:hypothetical protein